MEKPKRFFRWEEDWHYDLGVVHAGRVSMPLGVITTLYGALTGLLFFVGVILGVSAVTPVVFFISLWMLLFAVLVGAIVGLVALFRWAADSITIEGPGR